MPEPGGISGAPRSPDPVPRALRLSAPARRDLVAILKWTRQEFGAAATKRYADLITQALRDLSSDPERPGSKARPEIAGAHGTVHTWRLALSRKRVPGLAVNRLRHFIVYRHRGNVVELARILHLSRDLARHIPEDFA